MSAEALAAAIAHLDAAMVILTGAHFAAEEADRADELGALVERLIDLRHGLQAFAAAEESA